MAPERAHRVCRYLPMDIAPGEHGRWAENSGGLMPGAVLIIVDLLNDFFEQSPILASQRVRLVTATNLFARGLRSVGLPVFWVRQD